MRTWPAAARRGTELTAAVDGRARAWAVTPRARWRVWAELLTRSNAWGRDAWGRRGWMAWRAAAVTDEREVRGRRMCGRVGTEVREMKRRCV